MHGTSRVLFYSKCIYLDGSSARSVIKCWPQSFLLMSAIFDHKECDQNQRVAIGNDSINCTLNIRNRVPFKIFVFMELCVNFDAISRVAFMLVFVCDYV